MVEQCKAALIALISFPLSVPFLICTTHIHMLHTHIGKWNGVSGKTAVVLLWHHSNTSKQSVLTKKKDIKKQSFFCLPAECVISLVQQVK